MKQVLKVCLTGLAIAGGVWLFRRRTNRLFVVRLG